MNVESFSAVWSPCEHWQFGYFYILVEEIVCFFILLFIEIICTTIEQIYMVCAQDTFDIFCVFRFHFTFLIRQLIQLVLACMIIIIREMMDTQIHSEDYLDSNVQAASFGCDSMNLFGFEWCGHYTAYKSTSDAKKGWREWSYEVNYEKAYASNDSKSSKVEKVHSLQERRKTIGKNLSFAASESYKLLRTNLTLSMSDESNFKVIGITSALRGEGKSSTAINLAYTMAEANKRVLLIEADMRMPLLAKTLWINECPGFVQCACGCKSAKRGIAILYVAGIPVRASGRWNTTQSLGIAFVGKNGTTHEGVVRCLITSLWIFRQ